MADKERMRQGKGRGYGIVFGGKIDIFYPVEY